MPSLKNSLTTGEFACIAKVEIESCILKQGYIVDYSGNSNQLIILLLNEISNNISQK